MPDSSSFKMYNPTTSSFMDKFYSKIFYYIEINLPASLDYRKPLTDWNLVSSWEYSPMTEGYSIFFKDIFKVFRYKTDDNSSYVDNYINKISFGFYIYSTEEKREHIAVKKLNYVLSHIDSFPHLKEMFNIKDEDLKTTLWRQYNLKTHKEVTVEIE